MSKKHTLILISVCLIISLAIGIFTATVFHLLPRFKNDVNIFFIKIIIY